MTGPSPPGRSVLVVSLGGTIAMLPTETRAEVTPALDADELVAAVPALSGAAQITTHALRRVPGAHLTIDDMIELAVLIERSVAEQGFDGIVVTQGTDTIEETAFALDLLVSCSEPVVVTGAMRHPSAAGADGPANLLAAVQVAASRAARDLGALVVLEDRIHAARFVRKAHASSPSAFASAVGPLGWVAEGTPRIALRPARRTPCQRPAPGASAEPVALVTVALGDDGRILRALPELGFGGAVVEAFGGGHVPVPVADAIGLISATMPVVVTSRARRGEVLRRTYGFTGSETDLAARGALSGGWLQGPAARVLLTLLLRRGLDRGAIEAVVDYLVGGGEPPLSERPPAGIAP
ncbi:MAG: asparaginase [Solirubrobacteraceae bacterium]|nr:asparaginase [Solirubrobacteraceae bacterium]